MSLRQKVDRERIQNFFMKLGRRFRQAGKIYLVGGTTLVFEQLREQTVDIDVVIEVSPRWGVKVLNRIPWNLKKIFAPWKPYGGVKIKIGKIGGHCAWNHLPTKEVSQKIIGNCEEFMKETERFFKK